MVEPGREMVVAGPGGALMEPRRWSDEEKAIMMDTVAKGLSTPEFKLFIAMSSAMQLDPLAREIYAVKYGGRMVLQVGIDGYRGIAYDTGNYQGSENGRVFYEDKQGKKQTVKMEELDPDDVKRYISASIDVVSKDGFKQTGTATYRSFAKPSFDNWKNMPELMLLKCAEAQALRKAFPRRYKGVYIHEEMAQAQADAIDVQFAEVPAEGDKVDKPKQQTTGRRQAKPQKPLPPQDPDRKDDPPPPAEEHPPAQSAVDAPHDEPADGERKDGKMFPEEEPTPISEVISTVKRYFVGSYKLSEDGWKYAVSLILGEFQVGELGDIPIERSDDLRKFCKTKLMAELQQENYLPMPRR